MFLPLRANNLLHLWQQALSHRLSKCNHTFECSPLALLCFATLCPVLQVVIIMKLLYMRTLHVKLWAECGEAWQLSREREGWVGAEWIDFESRASVS